MKEFNRFDMEQQLMTCWNVCEDLQSVYEGVMDRDMDTDRIANALIGMKEIYHLKFEKLWEQFEALCYQDVQRNDFATQPRVQKYESEGANWPFAGPQS